MLFKNKKILYIFLFLVCAFVICLIRYLSSNNCFWGDDFEFSIYSVNEHTFDCLIGESRLEHGGYYLGSFLCKFMCFKLPLLLKLHPSDFIINVSLFNGLFFIIISVLAAKFAVIHKKSTPVFGTFFCLFLFCSLFFAAYADILTVNYAFYRYCFSLLFYCVFWYYMYKHLLYNYEKQNVPALWGVCLCGFVVGTSIEIAFFSSLFLVCLIFIYDKVICCFIKAPDDTDFKKSYKYNLGKNFYYPVLCLFIGILMFTTTHGFIDVAKSRGLGHTDIFDINLINEFFTHFFNIYILDIWFYWLTFLLMSIAGIIFAIKRKDIKKIVFPFFMEISLVSVILSLITLGKTCNGTFFICQHNIIFIFKALILIPFFILFSYFFKNIAFYIKSVNHKSFTMSLIAVFLFIILFTYFFYDYVNKTGYYIENMRQRVHISRMNFYVAEKMLRFFYLKNKVPEIPREVCIIQQSFIDSDFDNHNVITENKLSYVYYAKIYKDKKAKHTGYKYSDDALKKFYDEGGLFTKEELEQLKFSKLFNDDFVLNKIHNNAQRKLNYDEMHQRLLKFVEN